MNSSVENRPVDTSSRVEEYIAPDVNIFETADGYVVEAEMPGVGRDSLDVTVEGSEITITGLRNDGPGQAETVFRERRTENYRRVFELDPAIDTGKISARIEQGLLTVMLPKSERVKPQKIAVG